MAETKELTLKTFSGWEVKDAEKGEVEAIIATVGVVDHDGDIIDKESVPSDAKAAMSDYGHSLVFGKRPVGKGKLFVEGNKLKFGGRLFLKTADGRETFETLKEMGSDQEWSFGFYTLGEEVPTEAQRKQGAFRVITKMDPFEVSPVFRGAGIGTRTLGVKERTAESQADGAADDDLVKEVVAEITARRAAAQLEAKRIRDEADVKAAAEQEAERVRVEAETARVAAETKAAEDADAAARVAAETKAAEDAEAARLQPLTAIRDRFLRISDEHAPTPAREFERFQKTMQRHKVG